LFTLFGYALVALGLYGVFLTFKANSYAAGTVGVEKEQKLVTSGLYAWVRHPMYASAFFLLIGVPLSLGSVWGEVPAVVLMVLIVWRLLEEEKTLRKDLKGYTEYAAKVRARLIPGIF
jgi:protein-S-isoprenylcysteine O-methyltransferase Ste14